MSCVLIISLFMAASTVSASSGAGLSWNFQETGYQAGLPITALAMRDGLTWPVIFAPDEYGYAVKAISLYPVANNYAVNPRTSEMTYWHRIGSNLMQIEPSNPEFLTLRAASSPTGQFAAVANDCLGYTDPYFHSAVIGSSLTGFAPLGNSIYGVDYDTDGNLVTLTPSTLPGISPEYLLDIDSSIPGTTGAVSYAPEGPPFLRYHQTSPLLGGWFSSQLPYQELFKPDLALDTLGRPHIAALSGDLYYGGDMCNIVVNDFDVITGRWATTTLDTIEVIDLTVGVTMAADGLGGVGVAWVSYDGYNNPTLKYAYKNGIDPWATHVVTSSLMGQGINPTQTPGLAFDGNDFPVISFVTNQGMIGLAYDPPAVPEPSSVLLLLSGLICVAFSRKRRR